MVRGLRAAWPALAEASATAAMSRASRLVECCALGETRRPMEPFAGEPLVAPHFSRRTQLAAACGLVALSLVLYARTLGYEFLDWDDPEQVVDNPWIRSLSLDHLGAIFSQPIVGAFFPLQSLSFMLDYALWGLDPRGYHAQSVLLNALNAALAFWVLGRITRRPALSLVAALLWSAHHTHVEAVAWVSGRKELLSTTLVLLSLGAYLRARSRGALDRRFYALALTSFGLATAAKVTVASYVLFFLLVDWIEDARLSPELRRPLHYHLASKLLFVAAALPFVLMNLSVQPVASLGAGNALDYTLVRGQAGWRYLWLLLGVLPGQPLYDPPPISHDPRLAAAIMVPLVAPLAAFLFALRRGWTNVVLGIAWLGIGLFAPLAFPLVTYMADRYLYLPSLGFCWLLAAGIVNLAFARGVSRAGIVVAMMLTALPIALYAFRTWNYTPAWRNSESLWTRAVATSHRDDRPATALSKVFLQQRRFAEAERVLTAAPELGPIGYLHLAIAYQKQDRIDDALRACERGVASARRRPPAPEDAAKLMHLHGVLLAQRNRSDEAMEAWRAALVFDPDHLGARAALRAAERDAAAAAGGETP
jgi:tetratricopeptide (TPR) repeat protein